MKLQTIIDRLGDTLMAVSPNCQPNPHRSITAICHHSDAVVPGALFFALPGSNTDGHAYIQKALDQGAAAVVAERLPAMCAPVLQVTDCRRALAGAAACFYGDPSERLCIVGITGTNGKTTTAGLIENILAHADLRCGVIGTIDCHYNGRHFENPLTTPESVDIQRILAEMLADGITHVVMEISSHAIDQQRIAGCHIDTAVFTNLTQDHLDYHGSMDQYWAVKKRLFTELPASGPKAGHAAAIINNGHEHGAELVEQLTQYRPDIDVWPVSIAPYRHRAHASDGWVQAGQHRLSLDGIVALLDSSCGQLEIDASLIGRHNLENIVCAAGVGLQLGLSLQAVAAGINATGCIAGRLETVIQDGERRVCVDYAHTPDALDNVLGAISQLTTGKIICIFGCGGDRDRTKRPLMGQVAARWSDKIIVTSDNPRTEKPECIVEDIAAGLDACAIQRLAPDATGQLADKTVKAYALEVDRRAAIALGIRLAGNHDTVLIAGKGHETYQIIGRRKLAFDDRKVARQCWHEIRHTP